MDNMINNSHQFFLWFCHSVLAFSYKVFFSVLCLPSLFLHNELVPSKYFTIIKRCFSFFPSYHRCQFICITILLTRLSTFCGVCQSHCSFIYYFLLMFVFFFFTFAFLPECLYFYGSFSF